jgi:FkbM family methyltransferase
MSTDSGTGRDRPLLHEWESRLYGTVQSRDYPVPVQFLSTLLRVGTTLDRAYWGSIADLSADITERHVGGVSGRFYVRSWLDAKFVHQFGGDGTHIELLRDLLSNVDESDVFLDVGANFGKFSCMLAHALPSGNVVAVEPHPANADRLDENLALNCVDRPAIRRALSDENGTAELTVGTDVSGFQGAAFRSISSTRTLDWLKSRREITHEVPTVRGDDLIEEADLPQPTVVKIDVEGAELRVIDGMRETLENEACRLVYCEVHAKRLRGTGDDPRRVARELEALGFEVVEKPETYEGTEQVKAVRSDD